jgi:hypothetical protein
LHGLSFEKSSLHFTYKAQLLFLRIYNMDICTN